MPSRCLSDNAALEENTTFKNIVNNLSYIPIMTEKQKEKVRIKIADIRATLANERRRYGGYDDSRGLRYLPPAFYIKIEDYAGALTYLRWFNKNFENDAGFPDFLFEWTLILFKSGKHKEAEQKALKTFCSNTYLFDKFFGKPIIPIEKQEYSNIDIPEFTEYFKYSCSQPELADFSKWLQHFISSEKFNTIKEKYIDIHIRLKTERDKELRTYLILHANQLAKTHV
jgi:hypothetical protein